MRLLAETRQKVFPPRFPERQLHTKWLRMATLPPLPSHCVSQGWHVRVCKSQPVTCLSSKVKYFAAGEMQFSMCSAGRKLGRKSVKWKLGA